MFKPIFLRQNRALKKIDPADVVGITIEKNLTKVYLSSDRYFLVRSTFTNALKKFPPGMLIKIQRSVAISIYYLDVVYKDHLVLTTGPEILPIGKGYYKAFEEMLTIIE